MVSVLLLSTSRDGKMRPISSIFLFFSVLLAFHGGVTPHDLIRETCEECAQGDPNISYNFCVTSLGAAPGSHCAAHLRHLGSISIKLTRHNMSDTRHFVKLLLKDHNLDPFIRSCLSDCLQLYSDAVPTLKEVLLDYKSKRYEDANIKVSSAMDASTTCEDGFKDKQGAVSPLTRRNDDAFQLSAISLSIINMLLRTA